LHPPSSIRIEYAGLYQEQQKSFRDLVVVLLLALVLIFLVLLFEFRSLSAPVAILSSAVLSTAGVFVALLITKTKAAEAEGNAIKISAGAEREAARLRGQGVALFRQEVAHGMSEAAEEMKKANLDTNVILFSMWTEAIKNFAEVGKGNIIFLDGSSQGMENTMRQIQSLMVKASGTN